MKITIIPEQVKVVVPEMYNLELDKDTARALSALLRSAVSIQVLNDLGLRDLSTSLRDALGESLSLENKSSGCVTRYNWEEIVTVVASNL